MFLYFKRREKRGKREVPRPRFLVLRRKTLTVGAALLAAAALTMTQMLGISAGCGSHFRCCECARCRAGVSCDAPAAHLLRGTRLEGVQHFL